VPPTSRRREPKLSKKGAERRQEIVEAAFRSFARGGFRTATMAEIAADVGLTEPGLLHYFPSKGALLLAVLQERQSRDEAMMAAQRAVGLSYVDAFLENLRNNAKDPALTQLFTVLTAESVTEGHPAQEWFLQRYRRSIGNAAEELGRAFDVDHLPEGITAETVARWLNAMADGMRLQWLLEPHAVDRVEAVEQFATLLFQVLPLAEPESGAVAAREAGPE